jgi:nitrate reductase delta subunit
VIRRGSAEGDGPLLHRIAAVLLRYPDEVVLSLLGDVAAAVPALRRRADRDRLGGLTAWLRGLPPGEAARRYVETFDHTRDRSLYLTYYRYGDTRARGMALVALKHVYRRAGHDPPGSELPDYLPLVLEFASLAPGPGRAVLLQQRAGLELLRRALREREDPYAAVLDAVCGRLPDLRPRQRAQLARLAAGGPPGERVGLEPFAPPEYLGSPAGRMEE